MASPISSSGSRLRSTPPAIATSMSPRGQRGARRRDGLQRGRAARRRRRGRRPGTRSSCRSGPRSSCRAAGQRSRPAAGNGARYRAAACRSTRSGPLGRDVAGEQRLGQHPPHVAASAAAAALAREASPARVLPMITPIRSRSRPGAAGEAGRGQRAGGGLQGQPVRRVGRLVDGRGMPNAARSNCQPSISGRPGRCRSRRRWRRVGAVVVGQVQPAGRHAPERPPPGQDSVQQRGRVVGVREPAGQADHGDRQPAADGLPKAARMSSAPALAFPVAIRFVGRRSGPGEFKSTLMLPMILTIPKWAQGLPRAIECPSFPGTGLISPGPCPATKTAPASKDARSVRPAFPRAVARTASRLGETTLLAARRRSRCNPERGVCGTRPYAVIELRPLLDWLVHQRPRRPRKECGTCAVT